MLGTSGLLGTQDISLSELTDFFSSVSANQARFENKIGLLAFFEPSSRTKLSFESAGLQLGINWLSLHPEEMSFKKGESLEDTCELFKHYEIDLYVVRHSEPKVPHRIAEIVQKPVFNAGDGSHEHPTQALGDCFSLWKVDPQKKWSVCFYGDIAHSRLFRSNAYLMKTLGWQVLAVDDKAESSKHLASDLNIELVDRSELKNFDVVFALRAQKERGGRSQLGPLLKSDLSEAAYWMHAGPVIWEQDMSKDFRDYGHSRSLIMTQVRSCFEVRKQLLANCLSSA